MKTLYVLVGLPASGKSTWIEKTFTIPGKPVTIISRDDILEFEVAPTITIDIGGGKKRTYGTEDMFAKPPKTSIVGSRHPEYGYVKRDNKGSLYYTKVLAANVRVNGILAKRRKEAPNLNKDIVIDMTNMDTWARKHALSIVKGRSDYRKVAVLFPFDKPGYLEKIKQSAKQRSLDYEKQGRHKVIPDEYYDYLVSKYIPPSIEEGFDDIIIFDRFGEKVQ